MIKLIIISLVMMPSLAISADNFSRNEMLKISRAAGGFIGAAEYIEAFKNTECGYALPKPYKSSTKLLEQDVLINIPEIYHDELRAMWRYTMDDVKDQANKYIRVLLAGSKNGQDPKTACGIAAGMVTCLYGQFEDRWHESIRRRSR